MRREWIEISGMTDNSYQITGLPPCGGSGLKWHLRIGIQDLIGSPSMRREWIEITYIRRVHKNKESLPPCGGSGLK